MPRTRRSRYAREYRELLQRLVLHRNAAKITQFELARRMGTSQSMLSKLERGVVRMDLLDLFAYLDAIGMDRVAFIRGMPSS
jgi:transcriptional regulator with XRE-family HTH domain